MDRNFLFYENLINGIDFEIDGIKFKKGQKFWDLVVITSISIKQKLCYEKQLDIKLKSNRLPKDINFKVINDPDNCKIGSGGSTLNVIKTLYEVYASELFKMKILLIHAGGYSQRMPSCSVLGKIFSSIPSRSTYINDTFDLKMAIYTPFSVHMKPGIFLTSSDDFETFIFKEQIEASHLFGLNDDEFILLAHKSPLEIAKDHGVYVLNDESPNKNRYSFGYYDCKTVYQKPSIEMLKNLKLFLNDETIGEFAYTDSVFFFSHQITDKFLKFYEEHFEKIKSHKIEVDGYRDFLQPLGTNRLSISDFLVSTKYSNETQEKIYTSLYHLINKKSSKILAMTNSDFYHLGTVNEVMNYYFDTNDNVSIKFRNELCFEKIKKSNFYQDKNFNTEGCLIYSYAGLKCKIGPNSILEYCYFADNISLTTGNYTFLNNCMVNNYDGRHLTIPDNVCIHTIPVNIKKPNGDFEIKYVTIFFNRNDDLKKNYKDLSKMFFLENQLGDNLSANVSCLNGNSIWNLKIFRACDTMSTSFLCSYNFIENFIKFKLDAIIEFLTTDKEDLFSLFDLLEHNSYEKMIEYRLEYGLI